MSKELTVLQEIKNELIGRTKEFKVSLPKHIPVERFQRVAFTAISKNQKLLQVDRNSLFLSFLKLAEIGVFPDGREAVVVPYFPSKRSPYADYMVTVQGLIKLVRQSGELISLTAKAVRKGDEFSEWTDEHGEHLYHKRNLSPEGENPVTHVYAMAKVKNEGVYLEVMTHSEVEKIRRKAPRNSEAWSEWWEEMAKKSVIRRLFKRLPKSSDKLTDAVESEDRHFADFNVSEETSLKPKSNNVMPEKLIKSLDDRKAEEGVV